MTVHRRGGGGFPALLGMLMLAAGTAHAETIELVTYYPTASNQGDMHFRSLTVGTAYQDQTPGDGTALISDKLGIGTTTPTGSLEVVGPANAADKALFLPGAGGTMGVGIGVADPAAALPSLLALGVDTAAAGTRQAITIGSAGLGAPTSEGTASAGDKLVLWNAAASAYKAAMGLDSNNELWLQSSGNNANNKITFYTSNAGTTPVERMVITSAGNVGIGTATPGATVGMNGGLTVNGAGGTQMTVEQNGVPGFAMNVNNGQWTLFDSVGGTWHASLSSSNGNVTMGGTLAVGGAQAPRIGSVAQRLRTGNQCSISGFYNNGGPGQPYLEIDIDNVAVFGISLWPSSREQKTDISAMEVDTSKIYDLEPVSFRYKNLLHKNLLRKEGSGAGRGMKAFGLIAEDVEKYFPQLVMRPGKNGKIVGLDYSRLSVLMLPEMKKLKQENLALRKEVETLKERLDRLEKKRE